MVMGECTQVPMGFLGKTGECVCVYIYIYTYIHGAPLGGRR